MNAKDLSEFKLKDKNIAKRYIYMYENISRQCFFAWMI